MGIFSKPKNNTAQLVQQQEAAAKKEREKIALETAIQEANQEARLQASLKEKANKRRAFTGGLGAREEDEENRRKFLKGV